MSYRLTTPQRFRLPRKWVLTNLPGNLPRNTTLSPSSRSRVREEPNHAGAAPAEQRPRRSLRPERVLHRRQTRIQGERRVLQVVEQRRAKAPQVAARPSGKQNPKRPALPCQSGRVEPGVDRRRGEALRGDVDQRGRLPPPRLEGLHHLAATGTHGGTALDEERDVRAESRRPAPELLPRSAARRRACSSRAAPQPRRCSRRRDRRPRGSASRCRSRRRPRRPSSRGRARRRGAQGCPLPARRAPGSSPGCRCAAAAGQGGRTATPPGTA